MRETKEAALHVAYEVFMLRAMARRYSHLRTRDPREFELENGVLEAFLLHARCLERFFFDPVPDGDDVTPDYLLGLTGRRKWLPTTKGPALSSVSTPGPKHFDRLLAHISKTRTSVLKSGVDWPVGGILRELLDLVDSLSRDLRKLGRDDIAQVLEESRGPRVDLSTLNNLTGSTTHFPTILRSYTPLSTHSPEPGDVAGLSEVLFFPTFDADREGEEEEE